MEYNRLAGSETLRTRLLKSQRFNKYIFKIKFFICRINIYLRKIYILFVTQTFSVQKYISEMRYKFFTFSFIFFSVKRGFFSKIYFHIKLFFLIKIFFSANNVYFLKNTNSFSKAICLFFQISFATNEQPLKTATLFFLLTKKVHFMWSGSLISFRLLVTGLNFKILWELFSYLSHSWF